MIEPVVRVEHLEKASTSPSAIPASRRRRRASSGRKTREVRAVDAYSCEIAPDEIAGFLGPNGAGKTMTLQLLTGLPYVSGRKTLVAATRWLWRFSLRNYTGVSA